MPTVSQMWDIKSLFERFTNIEFSNKGRPHVVRGILEYHSNCPKCPGSEDSFIIRPETGQFNHCTRSSGCGWKGDAIDLLTDPLVGMTRQEAMDFLGLEQNTDFVPSERTQTAHVGNEQPPNAKWIETGMLLVERAVHALWHTSEGRVMLDYLHGRRLGDEIIKKKKLGFIPLRSDGYFYEDTLEHWGLDPAKEIKKSVKVANGILIPWFDGNTLWRLAIKRPNPPKGQSAYGQVLGSGEGLFNVGEIQYDVPAMIVEGEICAMSVEQEAGDLVSCVATGSTTRGRLNRWIAELGLASYVLQSFDEDESGDVGSEYWMQNLKRCMRWSPWIAKDPNDILRGKFFEKAAPCTLREWVEAGISIMKEGPVARPFDPDSSPTIPLARGKSLNDLVQERRKEKGLPPMSIPPWPQKDLESLEKAFSKVQVVGPEIDLKAQIIREYIRGNLAPGICLNKNCPCGT